MRVGWKRMGKTDPTWFATIGPCTIGVREMHWSDSRARVEPMRSAAIEGRAWVFSVYHYPNRHDLERDLLAEDAFEVDRRSYQGGLEEAQERAIAKAREFSICKRTRPRRGDLESETVDWLDDKILSILQDSYANWRNSVTQLRRMAEAGDRSAQDALHYERASGRQLYPEPRWSTGRVASEVRQYSLPYDLDRLTDRRFYAVVYTQLKRLKRRGLIDASTGVDDRGRETTLWEPA